VATATVVALRASNPQISTSSVEDHVEFLFWGAEGDGTVVLRILVVIDDDGTSL
jgi:hypothetical protein